MDAAEQKGVVACKWEDAPKRCRFNDEAYHWVTSKINGPTGMIKDLKEFGVMIQSVMPGRGIPPDMKLHYHDFDTVFFVLQGRVVWCVEGVEYEVGAGSFIYIPVGAVHEFIEVIGYTHVLAMVGEPLHGSGAKLRSGETVQSKVPWHEQFPEPRPRKVISTRNTCLYDGTSHHAPYTSDKERMIIADAPLKGMDAAEKKGVFAFKWEDAPKRCRFNDEGYHWVSSRISGPEGMIKGGLWYPPKKSGFGIEFQDVMPGRGVPPDMKLHYHPFDTLFLVLKGRVVWCVEGVDYEVGAGSFIYFPRGVVHELIEVIDHGIVLAIVGDPLAHPTVHSKVPWHEQFPEPRPRKVISTRHTCLYDGASHHAPYLSDKERTIITDESPTGAAFQ